MRNDAESRDRLEVAVALKHVLHLLLTRANAQVVQGDVALGKDVLARLANLLLGFGDDLGIVGIRVVLLSSVARRRRVGSLTLVAKVLDDLRVNGDRASANALKQLIRAQHHSPTRATRQSKRGW